MTPSPLPPHTPLLCVSVQKTSVCRFKNVSVCTGTTRKCVTTFARGAGTHGDVLNPHTEVFSACQAAPHPSPHTTHTTHHTHHTPPHHHNTTHTTYTTHTNTQQHTSTLGDRQTETEKVDRERERRVKCDKHCELQESCFFLYVWVHPQNRSPCMIRGCAIVLFPTYPQTSDGQEPHGHDSPVHYIHIRFVF